MILKNKMNVKNITMGLLLTSFLIGGTPLASLADGKALSTVPYSDTALEAVAEMKYAHYNGFTGKIESVEPHHSIPEAFMIRVQGEGEAIADFVVTKSTVLADQVKLEVGTTVTGWYDTRKPMILIYPPQYTIELVTTPEEGMSQKADYFDETLTSADGTLKLNLEQDGSFKLWDRQGQLYTESLAEKHLLVSYSYSTRSIPAQTVPQTVYVIEDQKWLTIAGEKPVLINGEVIHALSAFVTDDQTVMVPLRAAAEALGHEVTWLPETQSVMVGKATLTIGQDAYAFARMAHKPLGTAPVLKDGRTFVPLSFFGEILPELHAEMSSGKIMIAANSED
ncbi:stalk domain-containing protein [Acidaminobacter hydrogenoformans]|uniref:Copper amine oxidase N-terminal domain-containing protein n=1 Tax=Acidaminobacter hydrogenoformans DSM 2784 TaxID=1120920 RepID=A0A1G5RWV7_9FIRM|nr:stalk domain-containing protein [Acidaminobacter hydrogenoformans]SCZ77941.1 Copper amine oxidase N-terminal domain-containing protein [Acidaminobacter hydrogenoformans DSM 2784]